MSIAINGLTKIYGQQKAVNNISFSAGRGEILGFLGPNGAGKSTTMKMLTGYLLPDAGTASICGIDVIARPLETKKKIGYLPEANPLYYDMYVREYLAFIADLHGVPDKKNRLEEVIERVGLSPESRKKTGQLSKGYKQRVGLAAALVHDPEVLVLDEPTSGLDPNQIIDIRNLIKELGKDKTVLFSSHILQEVEAICDRVVIISRGNIVADSQLASLLKNREQNDLVLELKETVDEHVFAGIAGLERVSATTWRFRTEEPDALRRKLLEISIGKGLNIVSLQSQDSSSLEEVFRELTK